MKDHLSSRKIIGLILVFIMLLSYGFNVTANEEQREEIKTKSFYDNPDNIKKGVSPEVLTLFEVNEKVEFLVMMADEADLEKAKAKVRQRLSLSFFSPQNMAIIERAAVVNALQQTSNETQNNIYAFLKIKKDQGQVDRTRSFYIVNAMLVKGTKEVAQELALRPEVSGIIPNSIITIEPPIEMDHGQLPVMSNEGVEWNVERIGADKVWERYGVDGSDIVVGIIDTGVHWEHEALMEKWRGYDSEYPDPEYNWYDAIEGKRMPYDSRSTIPHGTHVMGTILGQDPSGINKIGVAPGASWIAAAAFNEFGGSIEWLLAAGEYLLAPWGNDGIPNPSKAPHIINNSWGSGCDGSEWYREMIKVWRAANILPVFSGGNSSNGYTEGTVGQPSCYPESIAVAALDLFDKKAWFSSEGPPSTYPDIIKPDISAPGVNIRSAVPGGYEDGWNGTSMASPHVSGAAALVWSANLELTADEVEKILIDTAGPLSDTYYTDVPNYGYGHGIVNPFNAVAMVLDGDVGDIRGNVHGVTNDREAPEIEHHILDEVYISTDIMIVARISDDVQVKRSWLQYRQNEDAEWEEIEMSLFRGDLQDGIYKAVIPGEYAIPPILHYRIIAEDYSGRTTETEDYCIEDFLKGVQLGNIWDLDDGLSGWSWEGDWEWGEPAFMLGPAPFTGSNVLGTNLEGNYSHSFRSILESPPLDLSGVNPEEPVSFSFYHWYHIESNWDSGTVGIINESGNKIPLYDFDGKSNDWERFEIDLSNYSGKSEPIKIYFSLESDETVSYAGWYLDNISFGNFPPEIPEYLQSVSKPYGITLTWMEDLFMSTNQYRVYRSETTGGPYEQIGETSINYYADYSLDADTIYYYVVTAVDLKNNETGYSNETSAESPDSGLVAFWSDFEADRGGFTPGGEIFKEENHEWEWGKPESGIYYAVTGEKVWATGLYDNYSNEASYWLESPVIDLNNLEKPTLSFAQWYNIERFDNGGVYISFKSSDEWSNWDKLSSYTGTIDSWQQEIINLDDYAGSEIKIRFWFKSDESVVRPGWFIDEVIVAEDIPQIEYASGGSSLSYWGKAEKKEDNHDELLNKAFIPMEAVITILETGRIVKSHELTGQFSMSHPMADEEEKFTLQAEAYGYYPKIIENITFTEGETDLNIYLEEKPVGSLSGFVYDAVTGEPIINAQVNVTDYIRLRTSGVRADGNFHIEGLYEGYYSAWVSAPGYLTVDYELNLVEDDLKLELGVIELEPLPVFEEELYYAREGDIRAQSTRYLGNGFAVRMTPHTESQLKMISAFIWSKDNPEPGSTRAAFAVFNTTEDGQPGEMVIGPVNTEVIRGSWNYLDVSRFGFTTDKDFFVVWYALDNFPNGTSLGFVNPSGGIPVGRTYQYSKGTIKANENPSSMDAMLRSHMEHRIGLEFDFDELHYTSKKALDITGRVSVDGLVFTEINGEALEPVESINKEFILKKVNISEGENEVRGTLKAENKENIPTKSSAITIIRDTIPPVIELKHPISGQEVNSDRVDLIGNVVDENIAGLLVNGEEAELGEDGSFKRTVYLDVGENNFTLRATDLAGNISEHLTVDIVRVLNDNKAFLSYNIPGYIEQPIIDYQERIISVEVEEGSDLTSLSPVFSPAPGASVFVGETLQLSGVTVNDFSTPVFYRIVAEDGSEARWTVTVKEEFTGIYGDVNGDGKVTVQDVILILRHIVGIIDITQEYGEDALIRAMVDNGETLIVRDAILIMQYIVGLIENLPIQMAEN